MDVFLAIHPRASAFLKIHAGGLLRGSLVAVISAVLLPVVGIVLRMRQDVFDIQCAAYPLVGVLNTDDQSIVIAAGVEDQTATHMIGGGVVLPNFVQVAPLRCLGRVPPGIEPIPSAGVPGLRVLDSSATDHVHGMIYYVSSTLTRQSQWTSGTMIDS